MRSRLSLPPPFGMVRRALKALAFVGMTTGRLLVQPSRHEGSGKDG